ncbi:hypothetical protein JHK82_035203 [Glycine max]|nr:hypothetical protein JHK85_035926 [Glycine max]KAG5111934.1 hypothetical protein JHK82_035203 [Glycine max]
MLAIGKMMQKKIIMPAHLMYDGGDPRLFEHYSTVAQRIGVYTANDYANILDFLVGRWRLEKLESLTAKGKRAQDYVCELPPRIRKLQERADERARKMKPNSFKYVHERESFPNAKSLEGTLASEEVGKNVVEGDAEHLRNLEK